MRQRADAEAVAWVLTVERQAGRNHAMSDASPSARRRRQPAKTIEVEAFSGSAVRTSGSSPRKVVAALTPPDRFHLYVVEHVHHRAPTACNCRT